MIINSKPHEIVILETFMRDHITYQISDHFYKDFPHDATRDLSFKDDSMPCFYLHSSVYLDEKRVRQPIYTIPQDIIECWTQYTPLKNTLILGCAGCTIPRFLVLRYCNCSVTGVELSGFMIEIAKRFFYISEFENRFSLIHGNAFSYSYFQNKPYDLIFIDLFNGKDIVEDVFSANFIQVQYQHLSDDAIIIINLLDIDLEKVYLFSRQDLCKFKMWVSIVHGTRCFLVLGNATKEKWLHFVDAMKAKYMVITPHE